MTMSRLVLNMNYLPPTEMSPLSDNWGALIGLDPTDGVS